MFTLCNTAVYHYVTKYANKHKIKNLLSFVNK